MLTTKHLPRPSNMLLKDYLRDDLSSCSSSGFKSFPRRQCCTTVRFDLLQKDLQAKRNRLLRPTTTSKPRSSSFKAASSTLSALHKASQAVMKAVRLLPFPSISATSSSSNTKKFKTRLLSKSLSRKVLSRSFWRKVAKEEERESQSRRWISFRDFLEEGDKPSDQNAQSSSANSLTTFGSSSECSHKSNDNSWVSSDSEFTWEILRSSSKNDAVGSKENTLHNKTADPTDAACTLHKAMDWGSEEKEQFSPVSVLDCPFEDEDMSSPLEGSKLTHKKSRHFDGIASVKAVELEEQMALDQEGIENENEKRKEEERVWRVVDEAMSRAEKKLVFDLLKERSSSEEDMEVNAEKEGQVWKEYWASGECEEVNLDWELMYIREMDKCGRWTNNISEQEWRQVGMELEFEIFTSLVNELVLGDS